MRSTIHKYFLTILAGCILAASLGVLALAGAGIVPLNSVWRVARKSSAA